MTVIGTPRCTPQTGGTGAASCVGTNTGSMPNTACLQTTTTPPNPPAAPRAPHRLPQGRVLPPSLLYSPHVLHEPGRCADTALALSHHCTERYSAMSRPILPHQAP